MSNTYTEIRGIYRVGRDAEQRFTPQGQAVTSFSAASTYEYNNAGGERVKITTWIRVSVWGKLAEICGQYVKKGQLVEIVGRLAPDPATGGPKIFTKQDGNASAGYDVTADKVRFLSSREGVTEQASVDITPTDDEEYQF